jgi:N utilization substance protein A
MRVSVFLEPDQVSLAIGKSGTNIKLASKLTGYEIDVYRNQENGFEIDDVELEEFSDAIDPWVIEAFKSIGCDTARQILELSKEEILRRTDLEEETVDDVIRILSSEFEE